MKKLILITLGSLLPSSLSALPIGNPANPNIFNRCYWSYYFDTCSFLYCWTEAFVFTFGFYGDWVFNRHIEINNGIGDPDIEKTHIFTNAGYLSAILCDRLEIFGTLGATSINIDANDRVFDLGESGRYVLTTRTAFSWSVGGHLLLIQCGCVALGLEGQYFRTHPHIMRVTAEDIFSSYPSDRSLDYREWQVGLALSRRILRFIPYAGIKYGHAYLKFTEPLISDERFELVSGKHWGYAIGTTFVVPKLSLTIEGRFADETALSCIAQLYF